MKCSLFLLFIVLFFACSKESGQEKDYEAPVIILNSPTNNQVFTGGQTILITGSVTDNKYIKEIHIEITNLSNAIEYLHIHIHPDTNSFTFNQAFTLQSGIVYKIRVVADDASTNSTAKSIEISCS